MEQSKDTNPTDTQDQALDLSIKPGVVKVFIGPEKEFTLFTDEDLQILTLIHSQNIGYDDIQTMIHRYKTETVNKDSVEIISDISNNDSEVDDDIIIVKDEEETSELVISEEMLHSLIDKSNQNKMIINQMIDEFFSKTNGLPMQPNQEQLKEKENTELESTETKIMETNSEGGTSAGDGTSVDVSAKAPKHKTYKETLTTGNETATNQNFNNFMTLLKLKEHVSSNHVQQQMHFPYRHQMRGAERHSRAQRMYPRASPTPSPPNVGAPSTTLNMNHMQMTGYIPPIPVTHTVGSAGPVTGTNMQMTRYIPPIPVTHTVGSADPVTGTNMHPNQTATTVNPENPAYHTSDTIWYKLDEQSQNLRALNNSSEPIPSAHNNYPESNIPENPAVFRVPNPKTNYHQIRKRTGTMKK